MKKLIAFLFIILACTGCTRDDDENQNPVLGTWKMVKIETPNMLTNSINSEDVSAQNITYTFDRRSNLIINTNGKKEHLKYEYKIDYLGAEMPGEIKTSLVLISGLKLTYQMIDRKMVLGLSYVDGPNYVFEKQ